jgi:predicted amino acid racemase
LVERLAVRGISVTGISKATLGSPEISHTLLKAGVSSLGDSRIENIEAMRKAGVPATMTLIRSPMLSQIDRVVGNADISFNTELAVVEKLSGAAQKADRMHGIVLMVELGDLREGIMPDGLIKSVREILHLPNIIFKGIGTNLACCNGVSPDEKNMGELSALVDSIEKRIGLKVKVISGGNSANINWALSDADTGRVNELRLGESILLGCETLYRQPIDGLHTDAITLTAEVIESNIKPSQPWGKIAQTAYGDKQVTKDTGHISQFILAIGHQDTDPDGLQLSEGLKLLGASSDHLILSSNCTGPSVGSEITFNVNYSALVRAMTSPFVSKYFI